MGTLKIQKHLEDLLADNSNKGISAEDVRTIVTSNYQPQMIYAALFSDDGAPNNEYFNRVMYYNPSFFSDDVINAGSDDACWKVINAGVGVPDGIYTNQTLTPPATFKGMGGTGIPWGDMGGQAVGAVFNFTVSGGSGQISNVELVAGGSGWIGMMHTGRGPEQGMVGSFNISGATTQPTIEFIGPIIQTEEDNDRLFLDITTNNTAQGNQKDHVGMNTLVMISAATAADEHQSAYVFATNRLYVETNNVNAVVSLWRMPLFA